MSPKASTPGASSSCAKRYSSGNSMAYRIPNVIALYLIYFKALKDNSENVLSLSICINNLKVWNSAKRNGMIDMYIVNRRGRYMPASCIFDSVGITRILKESTANATRRIASFNIRVSNFIVFNSTRNC